jgi:hypothetical protein
MADKKTQGISKGHEIPVPKKADVLRDLRMKRSA